MSVSATVEKKTSVILSNFFDTLNSLNTQVADKINDFLSSKDEALVTGFFSSFSSFLFSHSHPN